MAVRSTDVDDLGRPRDAAAGPVVAVRDAGAEVVAHRRTDGQVGVESDAVLGEMRGRPDARTQQHRRRPEGARGDDDLVRLDGFAADQGDARRAAAVDLDARDLGPGSNDEVVARVRRLAQVRETRRDASGLLVDRDGKDADARELARIVDVGDRRMPGLDHAFVERGLAVAELAPTPAAHRQRSVAAVDRRRTEVHVPLGTDERRGDVFPTPTVEPGVGPRVVVGGLAAQRRHRIDGRRPPEHASLRHRDRARGRRHRRALEVRSLPGPRFRGANRLQHPLVVGFVARPRFEQRHGEARIFAEPPSEDGAGGASADDDDVSVPFHADQRSWRSARARYGSPGVCERSSNRLMSIG